MDYDEARKDEVARLIKDRYFDKKSEIIGHRYKPNARHAEFSHYRNAADMCISLGVSPEEFVDRAFEISKRGQGPFPGELASVGRSGVFNARSLDPSCKPSNVIVRALDAKMDEPVFREITTQSDALIDMHVRMSRHYADKLGYEDVREYMLDPFNPAPVVVKVLLGYPDERFRKMDEALSDLCRPDMIEAIKRLGFNPEEIMQWLMSRT